MKYVDDQMSKKKAKKMAKFKLLIKLINHAKIKYFSIDYKILFIYFKKDLAESEAHLIVVAVILVRISVGTKLILAD